MIPRLFKMPSVKYSGPWGEASGYAQANRNIIQSLCEAGVDVVTELQSYANHPTDYGHQLQLAKSRQNKHSNYPIKVLHITPNVYSKHKEVGKYHIGHMFWETTKMAKNWEWYLHEVRELWTGCEYNVKCFREAGFDGKIFKFPQPIDVTRTETAMPIKSSRGFVFYSIFQWIERKDPKSLLTAYWQEFENDRDVTLVIKTYRGSFEDHELKRIYQDIAKWKTELNLSNYPNTLIIDYLLSDEEMHQLHESGDCFVSAHRGEGWGVPQVEALVHKKPVISTGLGGMHEWIPDDGMLKVNYSMCNVFNMDEHEAYMCPGNQWGQVDISDLRVKMRLAYEKRADVQRIADNGYNYVKNNFNFKKVGELMKGRLQEIYQEQKLS